MHLALLANGNIHKGCCSHVFRDLISSLFHGRGSNTYVVEIRLPCISKDSVIDMRLYSVDLMDNSSPNDTPPPPTSCASGYG